MQNVSISLFDPEVLALVKHFESLHDGDLKLIGLQPKMDPLGIWTEGYGRVIINPATKKQLRGALNKKLAYKLATMKTPADAEKALAEDFIRLGYNPVAKQMGYYITRLNTNQIGALSSFVYNAGTGWPVTYKIFENVKRYLDKEMTATQLDQYWQNLCVTGKNSAGVRVRLRGLVRRRKEESTLFLSAVGFYKAPR